MTNNSDDVAFEEILKTRKYDLDMWQGRFFEKLKEFHADSINHERTRRKAFINKGGMRTDAMETVNASYIDNLEEGFHKTVKMLELERKRSEKLLGALSDWLEWEDEQIKKEGAYVRPCINALINNGKQALKEYKSAIVTDEKETR